MPKSFFGAALALVALVSVAPLRAGDAAPAPAEGVSLVRLPDGMAFRVERSDVTALRVQVFAEGTGALVFDSGWAAGAEVAWRPGEEAPARWRYRVEARDGRGALVLSQTASRAAPPAPLAPRTSHGPSVMSVGSSGSNGALRVYREGSGVSVAQVDALSGGGQLRLLDESGFTTIRLGPDNNGIGGFLNVFRGQGTSGFFVDGNTDGTGEPMMALTGSTRSATFDMSVSGNASVILPANAVGSSEMFNEPGAASVNSTDFLLNPGDEVVLTRTITVPLAGHVLAVGTAQLDIVHTEGTDDIVDLGISLGSMSLAPEQNFDTEIDGALPSSLLRQTVTVHGLFDVAAGANTFRLIINTVSGGSVSVNERQLSLVYVPTAYGVTSSIGDAAVGAAGAPAAVVDAAAAASDAAERAAAEAVTAERVRREMRAMEERLRALEALVAEQGAARD